MKRNSSVELFRCMCMFGVVALHMLDQGGYAGPHRGLDNLMTPSVVGFLFISGYFGIKFSWRRWFKVLGIGFACALTVVIANYVVWHPDLRPGFLVGRILVWCKWVWFLWTYLALMLIAPVFEPLFEDPERTRIFRRIVPVAVLVFVWSYAATKVPILKQHFPFVNGFGGFGVLTFIGIYLVARLCRVAEIEKSVRRWQWFLLALVSGAFCWVGFMHYHSPFALLFAASVFYLVKELDLDRFGVAAGLVRWLGPACSRSTCCMTTPLSSPFGWRWKSTGSRICTGIIMSPVFRLQRLFLSEASSSIFRGESSV